MLVVLATSCTHSDISYRKHLGYERGNLLQKNLNKKETINEVKHQVTFSIDGADLIVKPEIKQDLTSTWTDIYERVSLYNTPQGIERILDGTISSDEVSSPWRELDPANDTFVLQLDNRKHKGVINEREVRFPLKKLKLKEGNVPEFATVLALFDNKTLNVTDTFNSFIKSENRKYTEEKFRLAAEKLRERQRPENKYKMSLCSEYNLFSTAIMPAGYGPRLRADCLYALPADSCVVDQVIPGGALIMARFKEPFAPYRTIFISGLDGYVDGDILPSILVKPNGSINYQMVSGAHTSVRSFKYLEPYDPEIHGR